MYVHYIKFDNLLYIGDSHILRLIDLNDGEVYHFLKRKHVLSSRTNKRCRWEQIWGKMKHMTFFIHSVSFFMPEVFKFTRKSLFCGYFTSHLVSYTFIKKREPTWLSISSENILAMVQISAVVYFQLYASVILFQLFSIFYFTVRLMHNKTHHMLAQRINLSGFV